MKTWLGFLLFGLPFFLQAGLFSPFRADYQIYYGDSAVGGGHYVLQALGEDRFRMGYQSDVSYLLLSDIRTENSEFIKTASGELQPQGYRMKREGSGPDFSASIEFGSDNILARYKDRSAQFVMRQPIFDSLLYQQQLRLDVAAGKTEMHYSIIIKEKQREHHYRVLGAERLTLAIGTLETIKVERVREGQSSKRTVFWLIPEQNYIVARLAHYDDGELQADMKLQSIVFY